MAGLTPPTSEFSESSNFPQGGIEPGLPAAAFRTKIVNHIGVETHCRRDFRRLDGRPAAPHDFLAGPDIGLLKTCPPFSGRKIGGIVTVTPGAARRFLVGGHWLSSCSRSARTRSLVIHHSVAVGHNSIVRHPGASRDPLSPTHMQACRRRMFNGSRLSPG